MVIHENGCPNCGKTHEDSFGVCPLTIEKKSDYELEGEAYYDDLAYGSD
jgi:hypothetical protein